MEIKSITVVKNELYQVLKKENMAYIAIGILGFLNNVDLLDDLKIPNIDIKLLKEILQEHTSEYEILFNGEELKSDIDVEFLEEEACF